MSDEEAAENSLWVTVGCSLAVLAAATLADTLITPNRGVDIKIQAVYVIAAVCAVVFTPASIGSYVFTELTVTLVGAVYPIYRATKAVCTPDEDDDKEWLQASVKIRA